MHSYTALRREKYCMHYETKHCVCTRKPLKSKQSHFANSDWMIVAFWAYSKLLAVKLLTVNRQISFFPCSKSSVNTAQSLNGQWNFSKVSQEKSLNLKRRTGNMCHNKEVSYIVIKMASLPCQLNQTNTIFANIQFIFGD